MSFLLIALALFLSTNLWVCSAVKSNWRLRVTQTNPKTITVPIYDLRVYDEVGTELSGAWTSSKGNTNIANINDNDAFSAFTFPPIGSGNDLVGISLQFACSGGCNISRVKLSQSLHRSGIEENDRVFAMILESSEDSGTTWVAESPEFGTNNQATDYIVPTARSTLALTNQPAANLTSQPTHSFSHIPADLRPRVQPLHSDAAQPSLALTDCRTTCSIPDSHNISTGNLIAQLKMPAAFQIAFSVQLGSLPASGAVNNVIEIRDKTTSSLLLRLGITSVARIRVEYNSVVNILDGSPLRAGYTAGNTDFVVTVGYGSMTASSSAFPTPVVAALTSAAVDTTSTIYNLNVAGIADAAMGTASGTVSGLVITQFLPVPSASPTTKPPTISSPSTVVRGLFDGPWRSETTSTAHSLNPTVNPSTAPTLLPTLTSSAQPGFAVGKAVGMALGLAMGGRDGLAVGEAVGGIAPSAGPTTSPTAMPTMTPTSSPTTTPTTTPSATPTIVPNVAPTFRYVDCTVRCDNIGGLGTLYPVSKSNAAIVEISLATNFVMQFDVIIPALPASGFANIIDLKVKANAFGMLKIDVSNTNTLRAIYNNVVFTTTQQLNPSYTTVYTTVYFVYSYGSIYVWTTAVASPVPTVAQVNVTRQYIADGSLYVLLSSPVDTSSGGTVRNIAFAVANSQSPSANPTASPSVAPTVTPTVGPSAVPTCVLTTSPSAEPSGASTVQPSAQPSTVLSAGPTVLPSVSPSATPSVTPTTKPSDLPTTVPTVSPTATPTASPSSGPSTDPTTSPTVHPSVDPSAVPSVNPSVVPTASPSASPTTEPAASPSAVPTATPSTMPTTVPTLVPSVEPSVVPSGSPSALPTEDPTLIPSTDPTVQPTAVPSEISIVDPTPVPSAAPSVAPIVDPPVTPSALPTFGPTASHTVDPSAGPTMEPSVSALPTTVPTATITVLSSAPPSVRPTATPSAIPTTAPSVEPSVAPSVSPSNTVTTACCRSVSVTLSATSLTVNSAAVNPIVVSVESLPASPLTVQLVATKVFGTGGTAPEFYPNTVVFSNASVSTSALVAIVAGDQGVYTVALQISGVSASAYRAEFGSTGSTLIVLSGATDPLVPVLTSAEFESDGSSVLLSFNAPTDRAGFTSSFPCSRLLNFASVSTAECEFSDASTISAYSNTLVVGSTVSLIAGNRVKAECTQSVAVCAGWPTSVAVTMSITAPCMIALPIVSLNFASTLGGGMSLSVDLASSTGSGGRAWAAPTFTVLSDGANIATIATYLSQNFVFSAPTAVPNALFTQSGTYTITATLCNFLGACNQASRAVVVDKSSTTAVVASIFGQQQRSVPAGVPLVLTSTAYSVDSGVKSSAKLVYSWVVSDGGVVQTALVSESLDPAVFRLSAYRLTPSHYYDVRLTVRSSVSGVVSTAITTVYVQPAALIAQVRGGSTHSIVIGGTLSLDASSSYDADVAVLTGVAAGLSFSWSCVQTVPVYNSLCPLDYSKDSSVLSATAAQVLPLYALFRAINTTALVTVTVVDATHTRTASYSVRVRTQDSSAPVVTITSTAQSVTFVNTQDTLSLLASVTVQSACTAKWSVDSSAVVLSNTLTAPSVAIPAGLTRAVNLVLAANALPVRSTLQFTLTCGASWSQIEVTTNGPPLPGTFTVSPPSGTELLTAFQFSASVWTDPNLPISYQFGFTTSTGGNAVVQGRSESAFASSVLPGGLASAQNLLTCTVQVYDSLNAVATSTAAVTVASQSDTARKRAIHAQLAASTGSNADTMGVIAISSAVLNSVSCASSPVRAALNRAACAKVDNTCGACLSGYVGETGDANTACVNATSVIKNSENAICTTSLDCHGWTVCDKSLKPPICVLPSKQCIHSCSQHGACLFQTTATKLSVQDCKVNDPTCAAVCDCVAPYAGASCNVTIEYLQQQQSLRSEFLDSLSTVVESSDASADKILVTIDSLTSITQNPYELTADAATTVSQVALSVLTSAETLGNVPYDAASVVLSAVDASVTAATRADNTTAVSSQMLQAVSLFSDLLTSQLVVGQEGVEYVQDSFRISSVRQVADLLAAMVVSVPLSALESATGTASSSVSLEGGAEGEEFAVSVIATAASAYGELGATFNSNLLQVRVARDSSSPTVLKLSLVHHSAVEFTNTTAAKAMSFNSTCTGEFDASVYFYDCPLSGDVLMHNCTGLAGVITSYCPVLVPSCSVLDTVANTANTNSSLCEVTGYDAYTTNCTCTLHTNTTSTRSRRLSNQLQESGLMDVVSSNLYLANEFANTFNSADDLTSLAALKRVLIVIVMFVTLWAGGFLLIFGCAWRRKLMTKANAQTAVKLENKVQKAYIARSPNEVRKYLTNYVIETFPAVFSNKPFFSRLYHEIKRHHRYLMLFTAPEGETGDKLRVIVGAQLLSVQTMLMFSLALLYDVQGPSDDGSCDAHLDDASCLTRRSPFDSSLAYCDWAQRGNTDLYYCKYQEPVFTFQVVIYIAVIVALLTAAISYPIDTIFELLSAPVADDFKLATQKSAVARIGRRVSSVARRASNVAVTVAKAARTKLNATRQSIAGTATRKIPPSTEAAHALATASVSLIADNFNRSMQERQMSRLRDFHNFGGMPTAHRNNSDSESSDSSDSDESVDPDNGQEVRRVADVEVNGVGSARQQSSIDAQMTKLSLDVVFQRRQLKPCEIEVFDAQWGIDPTGEFALGDSSVLPCFPGKPGAQLLIRRELEFVASETTKRASKLNIATDAHTGLEILHLFIKDLLGRSTPAARIFETKSAEDFEHTKVVSRNTKRLAVVTLVALNAFFVYYSLLTGFRRGLSWQRMFLTAVIIQFFVEICLFETMECVWINCCVPLLVSGEVRLVGDSIIEVVQELCAGTSLESAKYLNAPDYLFVSTNVAKKFPTLMESILVQAYHNHMPGELAKTWQVGSIARLQRHQNLRNTTLLTTLLGTLQFMGTAPFVFHRMFVRFLQPFVLTGLVLFWELIIASPVYIGVACAVIAVACGIGAHQYYLALLEEKVQVQGEVVQITAEYMEGPMADIPIVNDAGFLNAPIDESHHSGVKHNSDVTVTDESKDILSHSHSSDSHNSDCSEPVAARYATQAARAKRQAHGHSNNSSLSSDTLPVGHRGDKQHEDENESSHIDTRNNISVLSGGFQLNREALYADHGSSGGFMSVSSVSDSSVSDNN